MGFAPEAAWGAWIGPVRARCGGGAAAWVAGVLAAPGTQGGWRLGQQEMQCSRRYGSQYWPLHSSVLAWRNPQQRSLAGHSLQGHKELDMTEDPAHVDARLFAHSNSAPVRVEREGGTAAWLVGTLGSTKCAGTQTASAAGVVALSYSFFFFFFFLF